MFGGFTMARCDHGNSDFDSQDGHNSPPEESKKAP